MRDSAMTPERPAPRDPRRDPMPGDVLRKRHKCGTYNERKVDEVIESPEEDGKAYSVIYTGPNVCAPEILIQSWRRWAATATVVRRGEER